MSTPAPIGLDSADGYAAFLHKPAARSELHSALEALLAEARRGERRTGSAKSAAALSCPTREPLQRES